MVMHVTHLVEVNEYGGKWEVCNAYSQFIAPREVSDCCLRQTSERDSLMRETV